MHTSIIFGYKVISDHNVCDLSLRQQGLRFLYFQRLKVIDSAVYIIWMYVIFVYRYTVNKY